jgi:hypothetical protein
LGTKQKSLEHGKYVKRRLCDAGDRFREICLSNWWRKHANRRIDHGDTEGGVMRERISERFTLGTLVIVLAGITDVSSAIADEENDESPASLEALLATPSYSIYRYDSIRQLTLPEAVHSTAPAEPSVDFRDGSTLGRLKSIRQLSLLTITDNGKSRIYVGVSDEGVFGIHISFLNDRQNDRFAEVMRMPYLREQE